MKGFLDFDPSRTEIKKREQAKLIKGLINILIGVARRLIISPRAIPTEVRDKRSEGLLLCDWLRFDNWVSTFS